MNSKWLITGGAGYIGAHLVIDMLNHGYEVVVLDSMVNGYQERIPAGVDLLQSDIRDEEFIRNLLNKSDFEGIVNLAALKSVEESISNEDLYFSVNFKAVVRLAEIAKNSGIRYFLQSSTAAVYGISESEEVTEESSTNPISPYGQSKLDAELALNEISKSSNLSSLSLRFFNVLGSANNKLRDFSKDNLVPKVLEKIRNGQQPEIYGNDYPTPDGTCIRDYVHVQDISMGHLLAIDAMRKGIRPGVLNLGSGRGYSVKEVINKILEITHLDLTPKVVARRKGDIPKIIASIEKSRKIIGFTPKYDLDSMIRTSI